MANQTHRVLELIRRFNNNEKVCIPQLKNETMWYGKSDMAICRDLDIIKKVLKEKESGNLLISFTVTQELEVEELIKRWIPHMKVISPSSLKERIFRDLVEYME